MTNTDPNCIFCNIASGAIPVERLYDDELVMAFRDNNPQAPVHLLVIPKAHIASHAAALPGDEHILGRLMAAAAVTARDQNLNGGYRLVVNTGPDGGQTVGHLHVHVLGGRPMHWPPG